MAMFGAIAFIPLRAGRDGRKRDTGRTSVDAALHGMGYDVHHRRLTVQSDIGAWHRRRPWPLPGVAAADFD